MIASRCCIRNITPLFLISRCDIRNSTSYAAMTIISEAGFALGSDVKTIIIVAIAIVGRNYKPTTIYETDCK